MCFKFSFGLFAHVSASVTFLRVYLIGNIADPLRMSIESTFGIWNTEPILLNFQTFKKCHRRYILQQWQVFVRSVIRYFLAQNDIITYSCPSLVVPFLEELISRTFLDENQFWQVLQKHMTTQNRIGYMVFVSQSLFRCASISWFQVVSKSLSQ